MSFLGGEKMLSKVKNKKKIMLIVVIAAVVFGGIYFFTKKSKSDDVILYGNVDIRQVSLAFNANDRIDKIFVEEGDKVIVK